MVQVLEYFFWPQHDGVIEEKCLTISLSLVEAHTMRD